MRPSLPLLRAAGPRLFHPDHQPGCANISNSRAMTWRPNASLTPPGVVLCRPSDGETNLKIRRPVLQACSDVSSAARLRGRVLTEPPSSALHSFAAAFELWPAPGPQGEPPPPGGDDEVLARVAVNLEVRGCPRSGEAAAALLSAVPPPDRLPVRRRSSCVAASSKTAALWWASPCTRALRRASTRTPAGGHHSSTVHTTTSSTSSCLRSLACRRPSASPWRSPHGRGGRRTSAISTSSGRPTPPARAATMPPTASPSASSAS